MMPVLSPKLPGNLYKPMQALQLRFLYVCMYVTYIRICLSLSVSLSLSLYCTEPEFGRYSRNKTELGRSKGFTPYVQVSVSYSRPIVGIGLKGQVVGCRVLFRCFWRRVWSFGSQDFGA